MVQSQNYKPILCHCDLNAFTADASDNSAVSVKCRKVVEQHSTNRNNKQKKNSRLNF